MSLLSRYYTKQIVQRRMVEENEALPEMFDDNISGLCREISNIQEHLIIYEDKESVVHSGFFGL